MKYKFIDKCKENSPLIFFSALIIFFSLFFTRYFIKMDDGNFLGIVSSPDFTYYGWLTERYMTLSGRTVGEFLLSFFLKQNIVLWQIVNALLIIYIVCFWYKLSKHFSGGFSDKDKQVFCSCGIFLMFISCLNPSVFWFAGSFTYLWPFAGFLMTVSPLISYIFNGKLNTVAFVASFFTLFLATMQEQSAAICLATYVILLCITVYKHMFRIRTLLPLIPMCVLILHLLSSPGADERTSIIIADSFPRYADFGFEDKLFCGLAAFFANTYFLSNFLVLLFIAFLSVTIYSHKKECKKLLFSVNVFSVTVCILINYMTAIIERQLPHMLFRKCITENSYNFSFILLFLLSVILTVIIMALLIELILVDKRTGFIVLICSAAAICSLVVLGFSSSVFTSGQRTAFFTNMFIISACCVLFARLDKTKLTQNLYTSAIVYACVTFTIDCFAFKLFELPLMG